MTERASCIYEGTVRHRRVAPVAHELRYRLALPYVDLAELPELFDGCALWSARRPALAWFRRRDFLGPPGVPLADAVRDLVEQRSGERPDGPIRMLAQPRYLGYCFNPVSFYFCFGPDGNGVRAVVAEVTNTPWRERHAYVMTGTHGPVMHATSPKALHVSPFLDMRHRYEWRVHGPDERLVVHVDAVGEQGAVFDATLSLRRRALEPATLRRLLWRDPAGPLRVTALIYRNALALRRKGAPVFAHPGGAR
jgi:uncharacterized protein